MLGPERIPGLSASEIAELAESGSLGRDYGPLVDGAVAFAQVLPEHKFLVVETLRQQVPPIPLSPTIPTVSLSCPRLRSPPPTTTPSATWWG